MVPHAYFNLWVCWPVNLGISNLSCNQDTQKYLRLGQKEGPPLNPGDCNCSTMVSLQSASNFAQRIFLHSRTPNREVLTVWTFCIFRLLQPLQVFYYLFIYLFQNDATPVDDITVVYDVGNSCVEQDTELIPCPICRKMFATKDIEVTSACICKCSATNKHTFVCQPSIQHKRRPVSFSKPQINKKISDQLWLHQIFPQIDILHNMKKNTFCESCVSVCKWDRCF